LLVHHDLIAHHSSKCHLVTGIFWLHQVVMIALVHMPHGTPGNQEKTERFTNVALLLICQQIYKD